MATGQKSARIQLAKLSHCKLHRPRNAWESTKLAIKLQKQKKDSQPNVILASRDF